MSAPTAVVVGVGAERGLGAAPCRWHIHRQACSAWTHEIDLRPFKENF
jgi:hypothetical protein